MKAEDLRSDSTLYRQLVIKYTRHDEEGGEEKGAFEVRLHFTMKCNKDAKDWAEGLQYLKTYMGCKFLIFIILFCSKYVQCFSILKKSIFGKSVKNFHHFDFTFRRCLDVFSFRF